MADKHTWTGTPTEDETERMTERMKLFIFPNCVRTEEELAAFEKAVAWQIVHEKSQEEITSEVPDGVTSFRIGDFSMTFDEGYNGSGLSRKTICPSAYSVLLQAGLLYRGLEGRCCVCP